MTARGRRLSLIATILAICAFVAFLSVAITRLVEVQRSLTTGHGEYLLWAVSQAQYETQKLITAANQTQQMSQGALLRQYDITISRYVLLDEGEMSRRIAEVGHGGEVALALKALMGLEPYLTAADAKSANYSGRVQAAMGPYITNLRTIGNDLMIDTRERDGVRRATYNSTIIEIIVYILAILVSGIFLTVQLMRSQNQLAKSDAKMRREKEFLDMLIESSGEGVVAFDRHMICTHWNSAAARIFDRPAHEVVGQQLRDTFPFPDGHAVPEMLTAALRGEDRYMSEHLLPGTEIYLEKACFPVRGDRKVVGGIMIVRDVTERYRAQRELARHHSQLEELVAERTADLRNTEAQLRAAVQQAEQALIQEKHLRQLYRDFVSMVSHQFRTPLAIIDSSAQRMARRGDNMSGEEITTRAGKIRTAAGRLARLLESTLDGARMDAGEIEFNPRRSDLARLVREACERQRELHPARDFSLDLERLPASVRFDPLLMDQVVSNLISNATKYSPESTSVEVHGETRPDRVVLTIQDRGVGIPEEEMHRVFERFFRASTATGVAGTGIGLHVAREIVRMHGGELTLDSRMGEGTSVHLTLPYDDQQQAAE
ncbi:integral membrane sensor signal transduction histi dine kinase [Devosia sp. DBB001]|nr:integral membrane sensor signal transduction histi dine kinase [Devosia sp. DBB001]